MGKKKLKKSTLVLLYCVLWIRDYANIELLNIFKTLLPHLRLQNPPYNIYASVREYLSDISILILQIMLVLVNVSFLVNKNHICTEIIFLCEIIKLRNGAQQYFLLQYLVNGISDAKRVDVQN